MFLKNAYIFLHLDWSDLINMFLVHFSITYIFGFKALGHLKIEIVPNTLQQMVCVGNYVTKLQVWVYPLLMLALIYTLTPLRLTFKK